MAPVRRSRQAVWQQKQMAAGLCRSCGKAPRVDYVTAAGNWKTSPQCVACLEKTRATSQKRIGAARTYTEKLEVR